MNNHRRHELERNVLADQIGAGYERMHPVIKPVFFAIIAGLVGFFGYEFIQGQRSKSAAKNWTEYYFNRTSGDAASFAALGEDFGDSPVGLWSRNSAARGYLQEGIEAIYSNRKEAEENIHKAIDEWDTLKSSSVPELRSVALHGLALAHESLGELDEAVKYYEQYADLADTPEDQRKIVNDQVTYLKSAGAKEFYSWFNKLDPKPSAGPIFSGDLGAPPTSPTLQLDPTNLPTFTPPTETTAPAATEGTPAATAEAPATTAEPAPTTEVPAASPAPAAEVPASNPEPAATSSPAPATPAESTAPAATEPAPVGNEPTAN